LVGFMKQNASDPRVHHERRVQKPLLYPLSYGGAADHDSVASVGLIRRDHPDADRGRRPARAGTRRVVPPRRHGRRRAISFAASTIPGFRC